jgi:hypothetical protein
MPNNDGKLKSDGSYISELAVRAIVRDIPSDLVVNRRDYEAALNAAKKANNPFPMADYLAKNPQLQEQLAYFLNYVPSKWLLSQEIPAVVARRNIHLVAVSYQPDDDPYEWARGQKLQGICLSGGGIRSATFNLGILQGLAKLEMLHTFDYLSSVSGGGYIHEWLAGWIKREEGKPGPDTTDPTPPVGGVAAARNGLRRVQNRLKPLPTGNQLPFQPEPIRWLRRYSNYLTPQKGIFTADTWVAVAIWLRNTFLNQLILTSGLFFLVLVPHLISPGLQAIPGLYAFAGSFALVGFSTLMIWIALHREYERVRHFDMYGQLPGPRKIQGFGGETTVQVLVVLPLLSASALFLIGAVHCFDGETTAWVLVVPPFLSASVSFVIGNVHCFNGVTLLVGVFVVLTIIIAGIAFAGGAVRSYKVNHGLISGHDKQAAAAAVPTGFRPRIGRFWKHVRSFAIGCGQLIRHPVRGLKEPQFNLAQKAYKHLRVFFSAVLSSGVLDAAIAAAGGVVLMIGIGYVLGLPAYLFGNCFLCHLPIWVHSTAESPALWRVRLTIGPPMFLFVPFFGMVLAAGLVGRNYPDWLREWLARVRAWSTLFGLCWLAYLGISLLGPSIFDWFHLNGQTKLAGSIKWSAVVGWVATTAGSVMAGNSKKASGTPEDSSTALNLLAEVGPYVFILGLLVILSEIADWGFHSAYPHHKVAMLSLVVLPLGIFVLFGWRVDINDFSMNPFYRNRLTRCYLGATNAKRDPNPLTGFDDRDTSGMQISQMKPDRGYSGPLPIICTTVNLSFGEDLAWQERKAASFAFSPLYSGYTVGWTAGKAGERLSFNGFVPTAEYFDPDGGINISTAVAISGAAASPNWGFHTNPATAFLMTMFNVRLGWWMFNPRRSKRAGLLPGSMVEGPEWPSPRFAPLELVKELLGRTDDQSKYVYLSDGGHFDNMGLYELVRRRCYRIVICDAEGDENYIFEGLGMSIRKCRIDFGVEIELGQVCDLRPDLETGDCKAHFALGTIRYPETPDSKKTEGTILYIKSSLTGKREWPTTDPKQPILPIDAEPLDILNYKLEHKSFPHDTTANQWFTESQFESYRRLGQHVADEIERCGGWKNFS